MKELGLYGKSGSFLLESQGGYAFCNVLGVRAECGLWLWRMVATVVRTLPFMLALTLAFKRHGLMDAVYVLQKKEGITWMRCIRLKTC